VGKLLARAGRPGLQADDLLHVLSGRPADVLADHASQHAPALLVLGQHRDQGMFDLGGATRELLTNCPCPVWVQVPDQGEVEHILVPVDLFPGRRLIVDAALSVAKALGAEVTLLHCFQPPTFAFNPEPSSVDSTEDYRRSAKEEFDSFVADVDSRGVALRAEFVDGDVSSTILEFEDRSNLIVMGTHSHRGLSRLVLGNQTHRVLARAKGPVLAVPLEAPRRLGQG
jgi:nucleotide-binding universal stress UspA family protein